MNHQCHAIDCKVSVPPAMLMCLKHWRMVPRDIQKGVWATYRRGQEVDKNPSPEYMVYQQSAIRAVAVKEGKRGPDSEGGARVGVQDRPSNPGGSEAAVAPGRRVGPDPAADPVGDRPQVGNHRPRSTGAGA